MKKRMELKDILVGRNQTLDDVMYMAANLKKLPRDYDPYPATQKLSGGSIIARGDDRKRVDLAPIQKEPYRGKLDVPEGSKDIKKNRTGKILSFKYKGIIFNLYDSNEVAIGTGF